MDIKRIDESGKAAGSVEASDVLFGRDYNEALVHQVVTGYMANGRQGTRAQKGRSEINKSTRKPWKQKGTGRARAGMASSPLWRGGGKIFPSSPDENFAHKVNRKMYRAGMCSILSQLAREGRLTVVDQLKVDTPKTKALAQKIKGMGFERVLVITDELDENLFLAARNLESVLVLEPRHADPVTLLRFDQTLLTKGAMAKFEEILG
ncbi:MAG: 50S ribosomal protein L4 [Betaproteobacteria bacterium]|jgi:large subunit ribosomal protein L4|nr:50S ribosomal protein L4 [Rhodocyclaceae bacterium]MCA3135299.1 50S ribosomal protein L4 [Rhodocyclaceae bacterium]MCA3140792.1 50S ribosomal protein L4 [Rhodocyclaceae bacterium]MCA3146325.1 50S ribosomal protein L4 [Rhodocyclaceae bacterium]MCE2898845.1 50S ribosomal protein L4 [Betaproteobacteria bacterium]